MEHEKLVKSHGILLSVMKCYQFPSNCTKFVCFFDTTTKDASMYKSAL